MTLSASPKVGAYAALGSVAVLAAIAFGYPKAAAVGMPFLIAVLMGLAFARPPRVVANVAVDRDRLLEGETVRATVTVETDASVPWLRLAWPLPVSLDVEGRSDVRGVTLAAGAVTTVESVMTATRWGVVRLPELLLRGYDELGFFRFESAVEPDVLLRVYPRAETLRRAVTAAETQAFGGNELSRGSGDGTEFADIRPYLAGDRLRRINWRLSTRTGSLHINEMHPDRNTDVVIFLDLFTDVRDGREGTLDYAVRAAASLAEYYLGRRDRVGVIGFGGVLRWLLPAMGSRQIYRIVDSLIDSEVVVTHAWRGVEFIPARILPPKSLIVALTPLIDGRAVDSLVDLRARGFDLVVVEVMAEPFAVPADHEAARLAHRLWELDRRATRFRYRSLGIPIVQWQPGESLARPMEEAREIGRQSRWLRA